MKDRFHWRQYLHTKWSTEQTKYKCGMADVVKKKRSRAGIIGYINRILKGETAAIYDDYKDDNLLALISLQTVIEDKLKNIVKCRKKLSSRWMKEVNSKQISINTPILKLVLDVILLICRISSRESKLKKLPPSPRGVRASSRINLPKFEIKKFSGDPTCWKSFIESFDAAVHSTMELTDIEKINFLVNHVDGEAGNVIKGLLLSNDNYLVATNMLEDRFGDPQMLISPHMAKLLSLDVVSDIANVKDLRQLYDGVETQVRSLSTLGVEPKSCGAMLTPVLFSKIPGEFKLVISRKLGKSLWDINRILEFYNLELTAREKGKFWKYGYAYNV